jgi:hypothetical protein
MSLTRPWHNPSFRRQKVILRNLRCTSRDDEIEPVSANAPAIPALIPAIVIACDWFLLIAGNGPRKRSLNASGQARHRAPSRTSWTPRHNCSSARRLSCNAVTARGLRA